MATDRNDALLSVISQQLGDLAGLLGEIRDRLPAEPAAVEPVAGEPVELDEPATDPEPTPEAVPLQEPAVPPAPEPDAVPLTEPAPARRPTKTGRRAPKSQKEGP